MPGTRLVNKRELKRFYELEPKRCMHLLLESIDAGELQFSDFSLRELAEAVVPDGEEWIRAMDPRDSGRRDVSAILESEPVMTSHFIMATRAIIFADILKNFQSEEFVVTNLIPKVNTKFSGEVMPGINNLGDVAVPIGEGKEYPRIGITEDWVRTPQTQKYGGAIDLTKEILFFDRTGQVQSQSQGLGQALGLGQEKRAIDCVFDINRTAHRYNWKGTIIATYGDNSGTHNWDNLAATNGLTDWTNVSTAEQLLAAITDPYTGEPVLVQPTHIICGPAVVHNARRIVNATEIRFGAGGSTSTSGTVAMSANPLSGTPFGKSPYQIVWSRLIAARLAAASGVSTTWHFGNPTEAFVNMMNWDIATETLQGGEAAHYRDVVVSYKASHRQEFFTKQPRAMAKNTA